MFAVQTVRPDGLQVSTSVLTVFGSDRHEIRPAQGFAIAWDRLGGLASLSQEIWPGITSPNPLLQRVIGEGRESDLLNGTEPNALSPLANVRPDQVGRFNQAQEMDRTLGTQTDDDEFAPARLSAIAGEPGTSPVVQLELGSQSMAGLMFLADRFVASIEPQATDVLIRFDPDDGYQAEELEYAKRRLSELVPDGEIEHLLLWRAYMGSNSVSVDGATPMTPGRWQRVRFGSVNAGTFLVGRVVLTVNKFRKRPRTDFTMANRLKRFETQLPSVAASCPVLTAGPPVGEAPVVVAVHGTMGCAIPMADNLREFLGSNCSIYRYEHDTWLPVLENVRQLSRYFDDMKPGRILLVAHSRGGLVARQAGDKLKRHGWTVRVVTLGTPFAGTPMIDVANGTLLGLRALTGAIRLASGAIVIDTGTRLVGLMVRELPVGIQAMEPDSQYLAGFDDVPASVSFAFGGHVDPSSPAEHYGVAALSGLARAAFGITTNDLVVGTASAHGGLVAPKARTVNCDHFSYLNEPDVQERISAILHRWDDSI